MISTEQHIQQQPAEPNFLISWGEQEDKGHWLRSGILSLAFHAALLAVLVYLASLPVSSVTPRESAAVSRRVTPLVAPPVQLTQKAPNKAPLSKEFNLDSIPPHPTARSIPSPGAAERPSQRVRKFSPPPQFKSPAAPSNIPEAPALETAQLRSSPPPPQGLSTTPKLAPPQILPEEKPKLAFEAPGVPTSVPNPRAAGKVPTAPKATVDEAIRAAVRKGQHGVLVGDAEESAEPGGLSAHLSPSPGKLGSSLELMSDPMGVDFWPYLVKVLAAVRRNWYAVIPESARLGRGGKVIIQFAISRDGSVPKLVIATPSGAEALDRAAVAGISASNPFPPLPPEFRGKQIALQFAFNYKLSSNDLR
jgi:TonB family protein